MNLSIYLLFMGLCAWFCEGKQDFFKKQRKNHQSKSLRNDRIRRLAELTDSTQEKQYFRDMLLRPMLIERVPGSQGNLQTQQHIKSHMESVGWTIEEDPFTEMTPLGDLPFNNIIATLNPTVPRKLVLACHFDSKYFKDFVFVAATDSAVPCAMMLDLARVMNDTLWKATSRPPDVTLQFIFFDGEEAFEQWTKTDSIYGARHLAEKMENKPIDVSREVAATELDCIDVFILLDLIGETGVQFRNWFQNTEKLFERMQKKEITLAKNGLLEGVTDHSPQNRYFIGPLLGSSGIEDDHRPFLHKGVPVLHLISYPFPTVWHKETDNESALDFSTINDIGKILRVFVAEYLHLSP